MIAHICMQHTRIMWIIIVNWKNFTTFLTLTYSLRFDESDVYIHEKKLNYNCNSRYMPMSLKATLLAYLNACLIDYSICEALFNHSFFIVPCIELAKSPRQRVLLSKIIFHDLLKFIFCLAPFSDFFSLLFFGNNFLLSSSRERKRGLPNKRKKNNRAAHTHHMPMRLEREGWASKHAAQLASRRKEIKIWNMKSSDISSNYFIIYPIFRSKKKLVGRTIITMKNKHLCHFESFTSLNLQQQGTSCNK